MRVLSDFNCQIKRAYRAAVQRLRGVIQLGPRSQLDCAPCFLLSSACQHKISNDKFSSNTRTDPSEWRPCYFASKKASQDVRVEFSDTIKPNKHCWPCQDLLEPRASVSHIPSPVRIVSDYAHGSEPKSFRCSFYAFVFCFLPWLPLFPVHRCIAVFLLSNCSCFSMPFASK